MPRSGAYRSAIHSLDDPVFFTKVTKTPMTPASPAYVTHVLDPAGIRTMTLRSTRIIDLLIGLDPKLVAPVRLVRHEVHG